MVASTPRANITDADALAKAAATNTLSPPHVMYKVLRTPAAWAIDTLPSTVAAIITVLDWRTPIIDILTGRAEATTRTEERQLRQRAGGYVLVEGALYKTAREGATGNLSHYAVATKAWYDNKLAPYHFVPSDMVLRHAFSPGKFQKKWEGLFIVTWVGAKGAYCLVELDGTSLPHPWNMEALRKYYV
ncbi:hypothetical protein E2562_035257 [Oryza meyeriana var. granulata]|uniref:Uncharacterized protein n=1 Tax=Oryza meyeriana var. granulata TaxID=110450 RepID=A0A6G1F1S2_9ORYZ|nr:hypothetical protein E2562_035257 [Oryza meyeriana var. granulata]